MSAALSLASYCNLIYSVSLLEWQRGQWQQQRNPWFEDRSDVGEDIIQIQIQNLEWVDRDEDRSDVGEDPIVHEPLLQILAYCSLGYLNTK